MLSTTPGQKPLHALHVAPCATKASARARAATSTSTRRPRERMCRTPVAVPSSGSAATTQKKQSRSFPSAFCRDMKTACFRKGLSNLRVAPDSQLAGGCLLWKPTSNGRVRGGGAWAAWAAPAVGSGGDGPFPPGTPSRPCPSSTRACARPRCSPRSGAASAAWPTQSTPSRWSRRTRCSTSCRCGCTSTRRSCARPRRARGGSPAPTALWPSTTARCEVTEDTGPTERRPSRELKIKQGLKRGRCSSIQLRCCTHVLTKYACLSPPLVDVWL